VSLGRPTARRQRATGAAAGDAGRWRRAQRAGRRWAVWGALLGLALGAVAQAPAQWLADGLHRATDARLLLAEARGSLWNGSAVLVLTGGAGSRDAAALPGRLHWQLRPGWRGLHLTAQQACCLPGDLRLQWQPGWGDYTVTLGDGAAAAPGASAPPERQIGHWPAAWLAGLGTPWNTLQLGGQLQLASPGLQLQSVAGRLRLDGSLSLALQDVSSRLSTLPSLGSYRLQVQGAGRAGEATTLQLSTQDGALRLSGSGQWTGARLRFLGEARATDGQESALSNLLNIIGRRQGALSVISIG
jgi:general secretion pathway protein N